MFDNSTIQSNFTQFDGNFSLLMGFGMISSSYYVMDNKANKVYILNDSWSYITFKTFSSPAYMISICNSLYMTGDTNLWKLDGNLNVLIQYNTTGSPAYRGQYYNSTNCLLYVAPQLLTEIHVFNINLIFSNKISTSPYQPWSITGNNNQMYVGTKNGTILVIQNEVILNRFNGCDGNIIWTTSILFDENDYFATSCFNTINTLYLILANETYIGKKITTQMSTYYIGFDSKGHFMQISSNQITIYN